MNALISGAVNPESSNVVCGQRFEDIRDRLEGELDEARRAAPDGLQDVSISRADVMRRAYTDKYV